MVMYLVLAVIVAMCTTPTGYALGSFIASGRMIDEAAAAQRLSAGVRHFVLANLPRDHSQEQVVVSVAELEQLHELADECELLAGRAVRPLPLTRRVLARSASRRDRLALPRWAA
jgi:hypothetical protein